MTGTAVVLPSPLLPPTAYEPLLIALRDRGYATELADASSPVSGSALVERWRPKTADADLLVAHSNAGYLAPLVRPRPDTPVVFVDAALPPAGGRTRLAPGGFRAQLAAMADPDGLLPPWTRWWPREAIADVIPVELVDGIDSGCPRVALGYLDSEVVAPDGWATGANAYLAFGDTYAHELAFATQNGWSTSVLKGTHLHFLWDPPRVAEAIDRLARSVGSSHRSGIEKRRQPGRS